MDGRGVRISVHRLVGATLVCLLLCACRTQKVLIPQTVPGSAHLDTVSYILVRKDSVYVYDSVRVREAHDTVWLERWHMRIRTIEKHDTLHRSRVDTLRVPYVVEKSLTRWQQTKQAWGGWAMAIAFMLVWYLLRRR